MSIEYGTTLHILSYTVTLSDNRTRVKLERRARLAMNDEVVRANVSVAERKPVPTHWPAAGTIKLVVVDDFWFETILDDAWVAAYRIVSQPEGLVVGEIRIFPVDDTWNNQRTRRGEWSGGLQGTRAEAPKGGVTARLLRRVRIDETIWEGRGVLEELTKIVGRMTVPGHRHQGRGFVPYALTRARITPPVAPPPRQQGRGRKRLPQKEYERLTKLYTQLWLRGDRGRPLYEKLAKKLTLSESQARNRVSRARKYGLLQHLPAQRRRPSAE